MLRQHGVPAAVLRGIAVSPSGRLCRRGGNSDSARTGTERAGPTFPEQRFLPENCYLTRKMKARVFSPVAVPETERATFPAPRFPKDTISAFVLPLFVPFRPSLLRCQPSRNPPAAVPPSSRISGKGVHPPRSRSTVVPQSSPPRPTEFVLPETGGASEPPPLNLAPSRRQAQAPWPSSSVIPRAPSFFSSVFSFVGRPRLRGCAAGSAGRGAGEIPSCRSAVCPSLEAKAGRNRPPFCPFSGRTRSVLRAVGPPFCRHGSSF